MSRMIRIILMFTLLCLFATSAFVSAQTETSPTDCAGFLPSRLEIGGYGRVIPGGDLRNNVRSEADTTSLIVGKIQPEEQFYVLDGPRCTENAAWWYVVTYQGITGWTAEGQDNTYYKEAIPFTVQVPDTCTSMTQERAYAYATAFQFQGTIKAFNCLIEAGERNTDYTYNVAWGHYHLGEYEESLASLSNTLEIDSDYAEAYFLRGLIFSIQENEEAAIIAYNRSIELDPQSPYAYTNRANLYFDQGNYEAAQGDYTEAVKYDSVLDTSDFYNLYYNRALLEKELGNYQPAIDNFKQALSVEPNDANVYNEIAISAYNLGDDEQALTNFNRAVELAPTDSVLVRNRGLMHYNLGDQLAAMVDYNRALELNPDHLDAYLSRGNLYVEQGKYSEAQADYMRALEIEPESTSALYDLALLYEATDDNASALNTYERILEIEPENDAALIGRGNMYYAAEDYETAMQDYASVQEINPENPDGFNNMGLALDALNNDSAAAIENYTRAIELAPDYLNDVLNSRGYDYYLLDEYDAALADFEQVLATAPDQVEANYNRALVYSQLGESEAAIEGYTIKLEADPDYEFALSSRAFEYYLLGEYENGLADLDYLLEVNPDSTDALLYSAYIYADMGEPDSALEAINQYAETIGEENYTFYGERAYINYLLEEYEDAVSDYTAALEISPDTATYIARASAYLELGEIEKGLADVDSALELDENSTDAIHMRATLLAENDPVASAEVFYEWLDLTGQTRADTQSIATDDSVTVDVEPDSVYPFTFTVKAKTTLVFETESDSSIVDPLLILLDDEGQPLQASDDIDVDTEDYDGRIEYTFKTAGSYTLLLAQSGFAGEAPVELSIQQN